MDSDRAFDFDVTAQVMALSVDDLQSLRDDQYATDDLAHRAGLDTKGNPFVVEVEDALCRFFQVDDSGEISANQMNAAREQYLAQAGSAD